MVVYAVYQNPKDYPGKFVVRKWMAVAGNPKPVPVLEPTAVVDTLEQAREYIPKGLYRFPPLDGEDPVIIESWF